jgi:hypothetical protein
VAQSFEVIFHISFVKQVREVKENYPKIEEPLYTALEHIKTDPFQGALKYVTSQRLQGAIHKIHVGGRKGHRLIYLYRNKMNFVLPVSLYIQL